MKLARSRLHRRKARLPHSRRSRPPEALVEQYRFGSRVTITWSSTGISIARAIRMTWRVASRSSSLGDDTCRRVIHERFFFPSRSQFGKIVVADEPPLRAGLAARASVSDEVLHAFHDSKRKCQVCTGRTRGDHRVSSAERTRRAAQVRPQLSERDVTSYRPSTVEQQPR